jgi:hypothetical protein
MAHHFTKSTESVTKFCWTCGRNTVHNVSGGHAGRCTEHDAPQFSKKQLANRERLEHERQNPTLFER